MHFEHISLFPTPRKLFSILLWLVWFGLIMESTSALSNLHSHPRWEAIWKSGLEPGQGWDVMTTSPCLLKYLHEGKIPVGRALVPGCGRGYDLVALCSAERHVTGLEISPTAIQVCVEYAHAHIPTALHPQVRVLERSFFEEDGEYDFIYDYTFLCALDPSLRSDWASKMAKLVKPGGLLMTLIFPIWTNIDEQGTPLVSHLERTVVAGTPSTGPRPDGGPPFRVSLELLRELLTPVGFHCEELGMLPKELCHAGRDGGESGERPSSGVGMWRRL